jgi:nitrite reductase/ring-hydroxylating ferredoxin subunit
MSRQEQIDLLKRLLHYVDTRTTALADEPWHNDVSVYTDAGRLAEEQRILFRQYPIMMGFASEWSTPGSFRTDDYAGVPILVVRGRDARLRAFLNVCRHRGAKVAQGCGSARLFSCPYHAWTYDLAGKLMGIPDGDGWFDRFRHRSLARRTGARARLVRIRILVVLRQARHPRDHELEDPR